MIKEIKFCDHCGKEINENPEEKKIPLSFGFAEKKIGCREKNTFMNTDTDLGKITVMLCDDCKESYLDERNRFMTYRKAFSTWLSKYVNYDERNCCEKDCEDESPYLDNNEAPQAIVQQINLLQE